ncbi:MAG TPA: PLP-dependent aminotransferase family protein [Verrucomicrobiae bacterium]|jgi:2-aminoadipate transaminase|nr:PLP-dependent aminotransferase family protein [Verrucomicrobiae bacterium]
MIPLHLQPESHVPLYIQLRDQIRALVHGGDLRPGERIPASRELAAQLGVHRTTVANAYAELESEGLISGHVGRGTFIRGEGASRKLSEVPHPTTVAGGLRWESLFADERGEEILSRLAQTAPRGSISFVMARPATEFFPIEELRKCSNIVWRREGAEMLQFGPSDGYPPLKQALVTMLRAEGYEVTSENLLITHGCQQALDLICKAFLRPGDTVLLENPAYPGALSIFSSARARILGVPVRTESGPGTVPGVDVSAIEAVLMQNRVKMMVVTPDFHNPTGTTLPVAERKRLLEIAARFQVPVIEDHIYARLGARGERPLSLKQLDHSNLVIQIDSFSKIAFPGMRVGWVLAPSNVIDRLRLVKQSADLHTGHLAQAILAEHLRRGLLRRHVERTRKAYSKRLAALEHALTTHMPSGTKWTRPEGGMCVWLELPPGFDSNDLLIHTRERGVLFSPGRYFYFQSPQPNALRLGFAGVTERDIAKGIATLADVLRAEMRKRQRGARRAEVPRVALV